jgi:hypothetical protein
MAEQAVRGGAVPMPYPSTRSNRIGRDHHCVAGIDRLWPRAFADARHEMSERTVWLSTQHTRQIASLLEQAGIIPDRPLGRDDIRGLPLTDKIWD